MSSMACAWEPVSPKGRARFRRLDQMPVARIHAAGQPPHPASHEGEGKLGGEQLVIGEAPARSRLGDGLLGELRRHCPAGGGRGAPARKSGRALRSSQAGILPFGQVGDLVERRADIAADHAR